MLKMVDGTGIIGVDMVCPLGGAVSPPQPPNFDKVEMEGVGSLMLPNSLKAPLERVELIGNSVQGENPSPDNPQEIKSAGRKSKNLFNKNTAKQGYEFPSAANDIETPRERWFVSDFMPVKSGAKYFISGKGTGAGCKMYNKDKVFVKNVQAHFGVISIEDNITYFRINGEIKDLDKIQVEEGNVATDYEPYGYLLDVKVTGKNLLNLQKQPDVKKTYLGWKVSNGEKITLSVKDKGNNADITGCYLGLSVNGNTSSGGVTWVVNNGANAKKEIVSTNQYVSVHPPNETAVQKLLNRFDIQVEEGTVATDYEPYTEQSMQIALDEPLRGIGDYKDMLTKDGVVRKIKRVVFDENTPFKEYNAPVQVKTTSFISGTTIKDATGETGIEVMSDRFKAKDRGFDRYDEECITLFGKSIFVRFNKDKNINTAEALTEWSKQNPLTVDYVLAEPVTEPLPESVQAQLQALHTENGTTHVFVDSGEVSCGIKLTYRKEK